MLGDAPGSSAPDDSAHMPNAAATPTATHAAVALPVFIDSIRKCLDVAILAYFQHLEVGVRQSGKFRRFIPVAFGAPQYAVGLIPFVCVLAPVDDVPAAS